MSHNPEQQYIDETVERPFIKVIELLEQQNEAINKIIIEEPKRKFPFKAVFELHVNRERIASGFEALAKRIRQR